MPWARVLDISLGGDPNFPSNSPTPTVTRTNTPTTSASPSNTPSMTPTVTGTTTQSITNTPTTTITGTTSTSFSESSTPTVSNTPTMSVTETTTQSISKTPTTTGSTSQSLSNTNTATPTISKTPTLTPSFSPTRPIQSRNIQGPSFDTKTPTNSPTPSLLPSSTASKSLQQSSVLQTEIIPITQEKITILDSRNSDIILQITFDSPNANEYLLISEANNLPIDDRKRVQSIPVSLNLLSDSGIEIQPSGSVEICMKADSDSNDSCLGFVNEDVSPPKWECEDKCLRRNSDDLLCGETDHFTNFAILFTGIQNNNCDDFDYIFDEAWKDGVLIGCVALAIICFLLIGTIIIVASPLGSKIVRGEEGHRISKLRSLNESQTELFSSNNFSSEN